MVDKEDTEYKLIKNAAGRLVPSIVNGYPVVPFKGVTTCISGVIILVVKL